MTSSELAPIINQFEQIFDKDPWYGDSILSVLKSVDPTVAFESPSPSVHSIAEIVAHIIIYREFTVKRLMGDNDYFTGQEESFSWQRIHPAEKEVWKHLIEKLETDHKLLVSTLQHSDDMVLDKKVGGKPYSFRYLLNGVIQHDLYHLGQISLITKILKGRAPMNSNGQHKIFSYENLAHSK